MIWGVADVIIIIEIKCTIHVMHLKYPQAIPYLYPNLWKNWLPWNWSLVPKSLGITGLKSCNCPATDPFWGDVRGCPGKIWKAWCSYGAFKYARYWTRDFTFFISDRSSNRTSVCKVRGWKQIGHKSLSFFSPETLLEREQREKKGRDEWKDKEREGGKRRTLQ